ncbi:MAG: tyrosine-type recombinase/integrase [Christensenellales bacterium]
MNESYFDQRDEKNIAKTREICAILPDFVMEFLVGIQMRTTPLTRLGYVGDLKIFFEYLIRNKFQDKKSLKEITMSDIEQIKSYDIELFLEYLSSYEINGKRYKCGSASKERKLSSLRSFFKYFYRKEKLSENVTDKVDTPKIHDKPIRYLEVNEIAQLLELAEKGYGLSNRQLKIQSLTKYRDVAILSVFLGTGIRISECVGLDRKDVDLSINAISVTRKGGARSVLYFSDEVAKAIVDYLEWLDNQISEETKFAKRISDNNALFLSLRGNRITVRAVQILVEKYCSIVSPLKKITPHKLRSTFGTTLYRETQDIYVVADVLGHRDINTTKKHYAAISDEIRRKAANVIKLRDGGDQKQ